MNKTQIKTILKDEICPECYSNRLFKCLEKRKCLDCDHEFESIKYVECSEKELFKSLD